MHFFFRGGLVFDKDFIIIPCPPFSLFIATMDVSGCDSVYINPAIHAYI